MKRLVWIALFAIAANTASWVQNGTYTSPSIKSESSPSYMIQTYSLTAKQAQEYENLLRTKKKERNDYE